MSRLAILALALPLLAAEPDWEEIWRNAQAAVAEGRDADAERALSLARAGLIRIGADDKDFAAHVKQLGDLYTNQGRFRDMERLYYDSVARIPQDDKPLVRIQLLTSLGWEYIDGD